MVKEEFVNSGLRYQQKALGPAGSIPRDAEQEN